ncbi:uncharacterized protein PFL1_06404 [Pseudozyma flocculosa PF-1]|uniref:alcohol dehydrogenase n=1 Tax=Pseudozyma flocculosa PF-1 TaxID=1277687 RepID=A0A061H1G3_9BASI|nr:uncharacterized protein PFL1_06404 [Pseudozyma flocculosa PF-1]EPQ25949.1 hypothetical protein PFL1_06404 [Pseudozyma flocculosa PF-1]
MSSSTPETSTQPQPTIDARESIHTIPTHHSAAVFEQHGGPVEIKMVATPTPRGLKPGEALVRLIYTGVCGTDHHVLRGHWPIESKLPLVGGHEGAGVVVALGPGADAFVDIGDRVGIKWLADSCLACDSCRRGLEPNCDKAEGFSRDGTFQQYAVAAAKHLSPIPAGLSLKDAAPILCADVTVYTALRRADLVPGQFCAILGAGGGLGHLAIQYCVYSGLRVVAVDTGEDKRQLCQSLGAETFIDFRQTKDLVDDVKRATTDGKGPHGALVAASSGAAYEDALKFLRPGGILVAVGLPGGAVIRAGVFDTVLNNLRLAGSYVGTRQEAIEALEIAATAKVRARYRVLGLSDLPAVFEDMEQGRIAGRVVLDLDK